MPLCQPTSLVSLEKMIQDGLYGWLRLTSDKWFQAGGRRFQDFLNNGHRLGVREGPGLMRAGQ